MNNSQYPAPLAHLSPHSTASCRPTPNRPQEPAYKGLSPSELRRLVAEMLG